MARISFVRKAFVSVAIVVTASFAVATPAYATEQAYKDMTCTAYNGYSIIVQGTAKGQISLRLDPGYAWDKGFSATSVFKSANSHVGGTHLTWVQGANAGGVTGTAKNTSACGTY